MAISTPFNIDKWTPKTELGRKVKNRDITNIDEILDNGCRILEPEIVDVLLPNLITELVEVGQSKGKFGGGKGSIWKQTQKKTSEGTTITFSAFAAVGNKNGYIGVGFAGSKETVPAREKAIRKAKLNIIKIRRGCGSWDCGCKTSHSIPFKVEGKCGSVHMILMPAPRGTGLKIEKKCSILLNFVGIKDIYSRTEGQTATKLNLFISCFEALRKLSQVKIGNKFGETANIVESVTR